MDIFFQQILNGLVLGSVYALVALGYTMVYGILGLINFAHGEVLMVGAMVGLSVVLGLQQAAPDMPQLLLLLAAVAVAVPVCMALSLFIERVAYRPLRNAPRLAPLITAIGVSIFLQEVVRLFYPGGRRQQPFPQLVSGGTFEVGGITVAWVSVFVVVVAVALMAAITEVHT